MTTKTNWRVEVGWWLIFATGFVLLRYQIVRALDYSAQTELLISPGRSVWNVCAPLGKWIDIPVEIVATVPIVVATLALFTRKEGGVAPKKAPIFFGLGVGFVAGIPFAMATYAEAIVSAFGFGFIVMMCIELGQCDYDDTYFDFALILGLSIGTFFVCGGLLAFIAAMLLVTANVLGILCGLIVGTAIKHTKKRGK